MRLVVEDELERLVSAGASLRQIASALDTTKTRVRRELARRGLQTRRQRARQLGNAAREAGADTVTRECTRHGEGAFVIDANGTFRCVKCNGEKVSRRRRALKQTLVREAGGRCQLCGYDRCVAALQFHHLDPSSKSFGIALRGYTRSLAKVRAEAAKCVLLCANCHVEVETGLVPLRSTADNLTQRIPR